MPPEPCAAGCVRPQAPSRHRAPRSYRRESHKVEDLAQHGLLPLISDATLDCISAPLWANLTSPKGPLSSAHTCQGLGRRIRAANVRQDNLDPHTTLTPTGTQYGATQGMSEQRKPFRSLVVSRSAVRVRSSALCFSCKYGKSEKPPTRTSRALSAVDSIPKPRPCCQRHVFPCWLSSASSGLGLAGWRCVLTIAEYTLGWTPLGSSRVAQVWRRSCQRISRIPARLSKGLKRLFTMFRVFRGCPLRMRIPRRNLASLR